MTNEEIDHVLMRAIDRTVREMLLLLRFDGGEPLRISEDPRGPLLYESQHRKYRVTLDTFTHDD